MAAQKPPKLLSIGSNPMGTAIKTNQRVLSNSDTSLCSNTEHKITHLVNSRIMKV